MSTQHRKSPAWADSKAGDTLRVYEICQQMRVVCLEGGLDLNTVLQGVSTSIERQLGCMEKSRFVATLQKAFQRKRSLPSPPTIRVATAR